MTGIQLSGLASGLDTDSIIAQLMAVEGQGRTRIELRQAAITARQSDLTVLRSRLTTLGTAAAGLSSAATFADKQAVTSSDETTVAARLTGGATPGGASVEVTALAAADQRTYAYAVQPDASTISVGGKDVALGAGATAADAASAINAAGAGVYAVEVQGRLVIGARETGAASSAAATGGALTEDTTVARPGRDAQYVVDGVSRTSASNVVTGAIAGVELTLRATGRSSLSVSAPGPVLDDVVAQVKSFIDAYNTTTSAIRAQTTEKRVPSAATAADAGKGALFGDTGLNDLLSRLRGTVDLGGLGISTGAASATVSADALAGKLTLDESKLRAALEAPGGVAAVRSQLGDAATALAGVLGPQTSTGGVLDDRLSSAAAESAQQTDALERFDARLTTREAALRKQFTALEQALARSQQLQSSLFGS